MESHYYREEVLSYTFLADSSRVLVLKWLHFINFFGI